MTHRHSIPSAFLVAAAAIAAVSPAVTAPVAAQSTGYLQCVPYARELSGVQIYGNANTWWSQAQGRYPRGSTPRPGAVMVFKPHRNMRLGHVAYVSEVVDSRTVRLSHANWSRINGRRGQIERNVPAIDVSANNDWSKVRVWYHSIQAPGGTHWPLHGFIYNADASGAADNTGSAAPFNNANTDPATSAPSQIFKDAFANL